MCIRDRDDLESVRLSLANVTAEKEQLEKELASVKHMQAFQCMQLKLRVTKAEQKFAEVENIKDMWIKKTQDMNTGLEKARKAYNKPLAPPKKCTWCGSDTHQRITHGDCPMNPKNDSNLNNKWQHKQAEFASKYLNELEMGIRGGVNRNYPEKLISTGDISKLQTFCEAFNSASQELEEAEGNRFASQIPNNKAENFKEHECAPYITALENSFEYLHTRVPQYWRRVTPDVCEKMRFTLNAGTLSYVKRGPCASLKQGTECPNKKTCTYYHNDEETKKAIKIWDEWNP